MVKRKLTRKEKIAQQHEAVRQQPESKQVSESPRKIRMILGLVVAALAFLLYANSLGNDFVLDDSNAITENHIVKQGVEGIPTLLKTSYRYGLLAGRGEHFTVPYPW